MPQCCACLAVVWTARVRAPFNFKGGGNPWPRSRHPRWRDASEPVQEMRNFRIFLGDKRLPIVASKMIWPKRIAPLLKEICNFDEFRIACQFWRCKNIGACRLYIRRDDQEITVGQIDSVQAFANAFGKCIASKHKKRHVRA